MHEPSSTPRRDYHVSLEVAGPLAIFTRPDTGGTPTSYPVPTWSAAKGLFESIAFFADGSASSGDESGRSVTRRITAALFVSRAPRGRVD